MVLFTKHTKIGRVQQFTEFMPEQIYLNAPNFLGVKLYLYARSGTQNAGAQNQSMHMMEKQLEILLFDFYYLDRTFGFSF